MTRHSKGEQRARKATSTLDDVAKAAGVTATTVARALKGNDYVATATRDRVLRIAKELNYTANPAARTLATGRTGTIAVITGQMDEIYYANLTHLLESQIVASGYQMKLLHTRSDLKDLINATKTSTADGIIVSGMHTLSEELEFLNSRFSQNCVFIDTFAHDQTDYVRIDLRQAVKEALELMMSLGRTRIAYVGLDDDVPFDPALAVEDRLLTYLAVMEGAGRQPEYINAQLTSRTEQCRILTEYFETRGCPDAVFCLHDEIAVVASRALKIYGRRVPEDVLLVGADGWSFMEWFDPPLSTIGQPMADVCALAWQFLQARITNPDTPLQQIMVNAPLIVRKSLQP